MEGAYRRRRAEFNRSMTAGKPGITPVSDSRFSTHCRLCSIATDWTRYVVAFRLLGNGWLMGKRLQSVTVGVAFGLFATGANAQFLAKEFREPGVAHIENGTRFGVLVGMDRVAARKILTGQRSASYSGTTRCPEIELGHDYCQPRAQWKDSFRVKSWLGGGNIELYVLDGRVISIEWWSDPFDP